MILGIFLILIGLFGLLAGMVAIGDIGIACLIGGITAFLSGIAHIASTNKIKKMQTTLETQSKSISQLIEKNTRRR